MDEREIVCSRCEHSTTMRREDVQSGWKMDEPGWSLVNYSHVCPACTKKLVEHTKILNERKRQYPMEEVCSEQ